MLSMRRGGQDAVKQYADRFGAEFHPGRRPWVIPCDVALPCAIQNELDTPDAEALLRNGCRCVVEGANMPTTRGAVRVFRESGLLFAPGKAANAGGVAISGLEMAQNRACQSWEADRVDMALRSIMKSIHEICVAAAERYGRAGDYIVGANIGGFVRVAEAMIDQGAV
jgi:glutamate dehydrogenase/leucine dehydrogenase